MNLRAEISVAVILIGFCLVNFFYLIPTQVVAEGTSPIYPRLINTMLLCFSLAYLIEGFRGLRRSKIGEKKTGTDDPKPLRLPVRPFAILLVTAAWVLSLEKLGFIVSTFLFLLFASRIFGSKSWLKTLALGIVMPLVIYFIFYSLNSLLPEGPLEEFIRSLLNR